MQITNEFSIALPPEETYQLLLDLEKVTPCMPGAELGEEKDAGARVVKVTVKLGPMKFVYDGTVQIAEKDDAARRAVLVGEAREARGQGSAKATITMTVSGENSASNVAAVADVDLTGRAAQMGRGVVEDVAKKMIADMAQCLEQRFSQPEDSAASEGEGAGSAAGTAKDTEPEAQPIKGGSLFFTVLWGRIKSVFSRGN